jgi:hypothetical protein
MTHEREHDGAHPAALGPPRFSLRALLAVVTALCCLFAVMAAVGLLWSAALALLLVLVLAHALGNSLGTKLRDQASRRIEVEHDARRRSVGRVAIEVVAPRQLTARAGLNRITLIMAVGGALVGGEVGGLGAMSLYPDAPLAAVGLGVVSAGVLGALAGFMASSFLSVVRQSLAEAHRGANPAAPSRAPRRPR